ncbi:MAG: hypothetical protein AAGI50_09395 [Pseudomonadota bacterium]
MPFTVYLDRVDWETVGDDWTPGAEDYSYEAPALGDAGGAAKVLDDAKPGLLARFFGGDGPFSMRLSKRDRQVLETVVPALKAAGLRTCWIVYHGGHDEGFAELHAMADADGQEIALDALLEDTDLLAALWHAAPAHTMGTIGEKARLLLEHEVPVLLASLLLGAGYGTGEYELYGRARLDLEAMTVTDDPDAPFYNGPPL